MAEGVEKIAELYFRSGSVGFGQFRWSYHKEFPDEPLAPWYLHYPAEGTPGAELLPELHQCVGEEFYNLCEAQDPPLRPKKIAAIPEGANPLAKAHASHYPGKQSVLLEFRKLILPDGTYKFDGPIGSFEIEDDLLIEDDHVSRSHNKRLILPVASKFLRVSHMLSVVDHEQGAAARLAKEKITLLALMTGRFLLEWGFSEGFATTSQYEEVRDFQEATRPV